MPIKTFSGGEVLTAADTNTYLTNSGLVFITEATAGAGSPSLSINNCFSLTYQNYRIVGRFASATAGWPALYFRMRNAGADSSTNVYYYQGNGRGSNNVDYSYGSAAQTEGYIGGFTGAFVMDVISPRNSLVQTLTSGASTFFDGSVFINRTTGVWHNVNSAFDGISFFPSASTLTTDFQVRVYGYRQA
jgi:hypothetical protein